MRIFFILLILGSVAACASSAPPTVQTASRTQMQASDASGFAQAFNAFRAEQGLGAMRSDRRLVRAAEAHAADMERRGYFSHSSVGGPQGDDLPARAAAAGCDMRAGAENIGQGQKSALDVFVAWRNSPGHRANLLGPKYTHYGLAHVGETWVLNLSSGC